MDANKDKLRVGMIRCDGRALWYGAVFDRIDPEIYAELDPWMYHHLTYYDYVELKCKQAQGFKLTRIYDADPEATERMAHAFGHRPRVCATVEEASDDVDVVFIACERGDGSDHLALATPGLQKKIPTFIDRPLAAGMRDAEALIDLAERMHTPLLSCSHLRMAPEVARFRSRFAEIGPVEQGVVQGRGGNAGDIADGIELALTLFGDDLGGHDGAVQSMGETPMEIVLLRGDALRVLVVSPRRNGTRHSFSASASGNHRPIYLDDLDDFVQPEGALAVMEAIGQMVASGKPPIPYPEMLRTVAVMEAGRQSHNGPRAVEIS